MTQIPIDWDRLARALRVDGVRAVVLAATDREAERLSDRADAIVIVRPPPHLRPIEGGRA